MTGGVRLRDGVEIDLADGGRLVADATAPGGATVAALTHAHGDHLYRGDPGPLVCSATTAALAAVRRERSPERTTHPDLTLVNAGHVPGSRAVLVDDGDRRLCYTGDVSTRDRLYLDGFEPPADVDVLVIEATYGEPAYVLPPQATVEREILDWLDSTRDRLVLLFGYALGRAQELQLLAGRADRRVLVSDAVADLSAVVADELGVSLPGVRYGSTDEFGPGDAVVLPAQTSGLSFVDRLREREDALAAGFSGWAVEDAFRHRGGYDATFALSDHAGFDELNALVDAIAPDRVYTQHGSAVTLADHLDSRGHDATALVPNQTSLGEFG